MGSSSLAFGLLDNIVLLDAARFVQGVGGACTWSGSLAWLIGEIPAERRGSAIGGALAAGIGGALFGPVIGTLAHALGRAPVFSAVVVVAGALAVAVALLPAPSPQPPQPGRAGCSRQLRRPGIALGMWLVTLPAIASGMINVLAPLRLSALGASAAGIGATFLIAAGRRGAHQPGRRRRLGPPWPDVPVADRAGGRGGGAALLHDLGDRAGRRRRGRARRRRARQLLGAGDGDAVRRGRVPRDRARAMRWR